MALRRHQPQIFLNTDNIQLTCEVCGTVTLPANTYSIYVYYPMPGPSQPSGQCSVVQHFFCSHKHATVGIMTCLLHHIDEDMPHGVTPPINDIALPIDLVALKTSLTPLAGSRV